MAKRTGSTKKSVFSFDVLLAEAKSRYINVEDQAEFIQSFFDFIKNDQPDRIVPLTTTYGGYDYQLLVFKLKGVAYIWYNIYQGSQKKASKLEAMPVKEMIELLNTNTDKQLNVPADVEAVVERVDGSTRVLFCSNSEFNNPIFSTLCFDSQAILH